MTQAELLQRGIDRMRLFLQANPSIPDQPVTVVPQAEWPFEHCAYWRPPPEGIHICLENCARPAPIERCRLWSWPGNATDREPYGVIAHELGHAADWHRSGDEGLPRGAYGGMISRIIREESRETPLTSYCPNDAEWFAEMFRLFVTNHALLRYLKPRTHAILMERWTPVSGEDWRIELGADVPPRIIQAAENKAPKTRRAMPKEKYSHAIDAGEKDRREGYTLKANPYKEGSGEAAAWEQAWKRTDKEITKEGGAEARRDVRSQW